MGIVGGRRGSNLLRQMAFFLWDFLETALNSLLKGKPNRTIQQAKERGRAKERGWGWCCDECGSTRGERSTFKRCTLMFSGSALDCLDKAAREPFKRREKEAFEISEKWESRRRGVSEPLMCFMTSLHPGPWQPPA